MVYRYVAPRAAVGRRHATVSAPQSTWSQRGRFPGSARPAWSPFRFCAASRPPCGRDAHDEPSRDAPQGQGRQQADSPADPVAEHGSRRARVRASCEAAVGIERVAAVTGATPARCHVDGLDVCPYRLRTASERTSHRSHNDPDEERCFEMLGAVGPLSVRCAAGDAPVARGSRARKPGSRSSRRYALRAPDSLRRQAVRVDRYRRVATGAVVQKRLPAVRGLETVGDDEVATLRW